MRQRLRLMAVHAHPDDESSKGAATMAKYVSKGVDVLVATCTGGERGSVLNPKLQGDDWLETYIHEVRREEMDQACAILGVRQAWLGFVDSGFPEGDPLPPLPEGCFALQAVEPAAEPLVKLIREFRPHVMTTYDEVGGYPHPDHIMTHKISMAAFDAAGDPGKYPEAGPAWQPQKIYYNQTLNPQRTRALYDALLQRGLHTLGAEWLRAMAPFEDRERELTTFVTCDDFFAVRDEALMAHATQIDPDGGWFSVPLEIHKEVWPTEEYELVKSLVDTCLPEDDLFAGLRPPFPTRQVDGRTSISTVEVA